ncbi:hypothetical protein ACHAWO_005836 [Cyclotella atomus]|uniref:Uncharacterized protein n=1 Tax=Cyclotella atomus TaxID=382360 RepID=A0ABD3PFE2_9STRA
MAQKAQNATMRQLMSLGDAGSASPSGLRDLFTKSDFNSAGIDLKAVPEQVKGVAEMDVHQHQQKIYKEEVKMKIEPIKPPSITRGPAYISESELATRVDGGIQYQGSRKSNNSSHLLPGAPPPNPYSTAFHHNPSMTYSTPDHLNPKLPRFSSDSSSCDSPVSYNSVLDHNSTPATVRERKRQQLQTIQSQEQMMAENYDGEFKIEPMPLSLQNPVKEFNWENIVTGNEEYDLPPVPSLSVKPQGYGATGKTSAEYNTNNDIAGQQQDHQATRYNQKQSDFTGTERQGLLAHNSPAEISHRHPTVSNESHTQHTFHYGGRNHGTVGPPASVNVHSEYDYHSAYHGDHGLFHIPHHPRRRRRRHTFWNIFCYPFQCLYGNDQLGRSFCFGAIDGMLTGAGILSACIGLGLLPHRARLMDSPLGTEESMHTEWVLIALTLAACFSDGICMAVGHVWSTRLVAGSTFEERKEELRNFETSRSDAKARLVDSLLSKGMLKIDAMSLADTLEGYPDMFVSALLGEAFTGQGNSTVCGLSGLGSGGGGNGTVRVPSGGASIPSQRHVIPQHNTMNDAWDIPPPSYGPSELHHGLKYESYSDVSDFQQDPDLKTYTETMSDSRLEGSLMMLSFGSSSVIPILIYSFLPYAVDYVTSTRDVNNIMMHDHPPKNTTVILLALGLTSIIMFLLGAWKSHFYSSHWCMFGMETVGILLLCIASAYSVGIGCGLLINAHFGS